MTKFNELSLVLKYAFKDLSRNYKKIFSIIVTLFISLFILSSILTIEDSLKKELNDNAKALLGGDLEIDYNRTQGNLELVEKVKDIATVSQMVEFSTMISTLDRPNNQSLFTRIKTIDEKYPLYGTVTYEPEGAFDRIHKEKNTILVNENIYKSLKLKVDEKIKVQDQVFIIAGMVKTVPDVSGFVAFGDFALTGKQTLDLIKLNIGSFLNYEYKVRFNEGADTPTLRKEISDIFKDDQKVILRYPENSASGLKRIINNFSQFLSLVSISAMLIAGIGIANTLLSFINQNNMSIAVRKAVGFFSINIKAIYYLQLLILLSIITLISYALSFLFVPIANVYISKGLPNEQHLYVVLEEDLKKSGHNIKVVNGSVSGSTSSAGLNRADWTLSEPNIDLMVLGLGANDMLRGIKPSETEKNLEKIILAAKEKNIKVVLAGMYAPTTHGVQFKKEFDKIYPDLAEKHNLTLIPFLLEGVALNPKLNQSDGIHPNFEGTLVVSKTLKDIILKLKAN